MNKLIIVITAAISVTGLTVLSGCGGAKSDAVDYASYVNPFIGTGGHGHTFPGAIMPHGMIQPSPDTRIDGWDACSGYYYSDSLLNGFTQTHLSGTGCADYGDFLIIPTVGDQVIDDQVDTLQNRPYASGFSKANEMAEPGYYTTFLDRYGVKAEITSTQRAALYRFTFPESEDAGFIIDLDYSIQNQTNLDMKLEVVSDTEIRGYKMSKYWAFDQQLSFYAKFSKPFTVETVTDTIMSTKGQPLARCKALVKLAPTEKDEQVYVKIGISAVDWDGARKNLEAEIPEWDFDGIKAASRKAWNEYLGKIDVSSDDADDLAVFYTAMYHTGISPNLFTDVDGRYLGMDRKPHQGDPEHPIYTIFSLWDTYRAFHPLMTIIDTDRNNDYINSLLTKYQEGGLLPMWELAGNYTATMTGYHAVSVMADALSKGISNFDPELAYKAAVRSAVWDTTGIVTPELVKKALMPKSKEYKNTLGFIPWDKEHESVAKGLEYAYDDWCISLLAEAAGDSAGVEEYKAKGQAYRHYFDPVTRFMRGRDEKGNWHLPFNPRSSNHREDDYCEGTAWQWTWYVPHDVEGLIGLMGGNEKFVEKLDSLFTADSSLEGDLVSADISGLIGQYAHGNEPSHHILHLYNYAGEPWKTQELVDRVMKEQYRNDVDGLSGNEDCGQMSSWYVLNSLGFYQVAPGKPVYSIGRPWFREASVNMPNGKTIEISVENFSKENKYIESVTLDGEPLDSPFFTHDQIRNGAKFHYVMSDKPTRWGVKK